MVWRYSLNRDGYGTLNIDGKQELVHRAVFIQTRGQIPDNLQINHICKRPYCAQPSYLYAGTAQDNKDDSQIFNKEDIPTLRRYSFSTRETIGQMSMIPCLEGCWNRTGTMEQPWQPIEQPAQRPLEEFVCPGTAWPSLCSVGIPGYVGYARPLSLR